MSKTIISTKSFIEDVYDYIKANNLNVTTKELKQQFGEHNAYYALVRLNATRRIRRVKTLSDSGIVYVYRVIQ